MNDSEILDKIKSVIPVSMEADFDFCLLQAYFVGRTAGYVEGVTVSRESLMETIEGMFAAKLKVLNESNG